jgi:hypothetical protein
MTEVFCSLNVEGIHAWYTCPIDEVDFLKVDHRHIFGIKAYKEVFHDDRDVEFIWLKHEIQDYLRENYYNKEKRLHYFGPKSCEMLAKELINQFDLSRCEVNEDNENGAIVTK